MIPDRFWSKVDIGLPDECWPWRGSTVGGGYGSIYINEKKRGIGAHRYAYEICCGPLKEGMFVCHTCDNPRCVNPFHLWLGSPSENTSDMHKKGRHGGWSPRGTTNPKSFLTEDQVREIRRRYRDEDITQKELAAEYDTNQGHIGRIIAHRAWSHV